MPQPYILHEVPDGHERPPPFPLALLFLLCLSKMLLFLAHVIDDAREAEVVLVHTRGCFRRGVSRAKEDSQAQQGSQGARGWVDVRSHVRDASRVGWRRWARCGVGDGMRVVDGRKGDGIGLVGMLWLWLRIGEMRQDMTTHLSLCDLRL